MKIITELLRNFPLIAALMAMLIGQASKILYYYVVDRKVDIMHFFESGGMPSAHSAMVAALVVAIGISYGWGSAHLAISFAFACIVVYDAVGVRRATGYQSAILNRIVDDLYKSGRISAEKLHEFMGHTPLEVAVGLALGVVIALTLYFGVYSFVA